MVDRHLSAAVLAALADTPVVALHGARQTGKSTLAKAIAATAHPAAYITLDDVAVLESATADPAGFVGGLTGAVVLDEIQRAPDLLLAIKAAVDRDRSPGRFLLAGSAQLMALPRLADTLAGRIEILTLHPFTQGEIEGASESFIGRAFSAETLLTAPRRIAAESDVWARVVAGGYPEAVSRADPARRSAWFRSYVATATERTVRDVAEITGLPDLRRLLAAVAYRSGSLVNVADLSRSLAVPQTTLKRYLALLEVAFLVRRLPAWSASLSSRLSKTAKIVVTDSGLLSHLLGLDLARVTADRTQAGQALEDFVVNEVDRQSGWSEPVVQLYHYRTHAGREVDLVLEDERGRVVGLEIKATSSAGSRDFDGLRSLAEAAGERFHRGVLLCLADGAVPFGPRLQTLPVASLWDAAG